MVTYDTLMDIQELAVHEAVDKKLLGGDSTEEIDSYVVTYKFDGCQWGFVVPLGLYED